MQKEVKEIVDGHGPARPFRMSPTIAQDVAKRPVPKSAKWHWGRRPYEKGKKGENNEQNDAEG